MVLQVCVCMRNRCAASEADALGLKQTQEAIEATAVKPMQNKECCSCTTGLCHMPSQCPHT